MNKKKSRSEIICEIICSLFLIGFLLWLAYFFIFGDALIIKNLLKDNFSNINYLIYYVIFLFGLIELSDIYAKVCLRIFILKLDEENLEKRKIRKEYHKKGNIKRKEHYKQRRITIQEDKREYEIKILQIKLNKLKKELKNE